jgi:hypothetical protein
MGYSKYDKFITLPTVLELIVYDELRLVRTTEKNKNIQVPTSMAMLHR